MVEDPSQLRKLRGVPKRQVTLLENWEQAYGADASVFEVETRLEHINKVEKSFDEIQSKIERLDPAECDAAERDELEDRILILKAKLLRHRQRHNLDSSDLGNQSQTIVLENFSADFSDGELKVFNGDYVEYPAFIDAFKTLVHNNTARGLNDVKRFSILKKHLGPNVLQALQHYRLTAENYSCFLEALDRRYGRKKLIFDKFLSDLHRLPKANNTAGLRSLADGTSGILKSIEMMATEKEIKDGLLIFLALEKCDPPTVARWEEKVTHTTSLPTWDEFMKFLEERCTTLECTEYTTTVVHASTPLKPLVQNVTATSSSKAAVTSQLTVKRCKVCGGTCSSLEACNTLNSLDPYQRHERVKSIKACVRCLHPINHPNCPKVCDICTKPHHQLLHFPLQNLNISAVNSNAAIQHNLLMNTTLLATVLVKIKGLDGAYYTYRALLDSGSQVNFVSPRVCNKLKLRKAPANISVRGVNGEAKVYYKSVSMQLHAQNTDHYLDVVALVNSKLGGLFPSQKIDATELNIPSECKLADPEFWEPKRVDLILSAEVFYRSLTVGQISLGKNNPMMQKTLFGWIVAGNFQVKDKKSEFNMPLAPLTPSFSANASAVPELSWLKRFWEMEEVKAKPVWSVEEQDCERHFLENTHRNEEGRFIVRLPFKKDPSLLGPSLSIATSRLVSIERNLKSNPSHRAAYTQFMEEYSELGHMEPLASGVSIEAVNFLPHFSVVNQSSTTTPVRVVFDASCKTASGYSLNDLLMVGPAIQPELFIHLVRFRTYPVAMVADMSKMYRQILVAKQDRKYQCILWRDESGNMIANQLNTVTYGTGPASFLAQRCLKYLAENVSESSEVTEVLKSHFYMDDMLSGAETVKEATTLMNSVKQVLAKGGFPLKKIMSNNAELLSHFESTDLSETVQIGDKSIVSTLGIKWVPLEDTFEFHFEPGVGRITKRTILSEVGRIFDPLGLLQPIIVVAKILVQHLWSLGLEWDDLVPTHIAYQWARYREELPDLAQIKIPRLVLVPNYTMKEIHCFVDASISAYTACVYLRTCSLESKFNVSLVCAKSKVAPLKTISLARLELSACLLGAELVHTIKQVQIYETEEIFFWTDSTTAKRWIEASPHMWKTFVATRVTKIQELTGPGVWRHVPGLLNPADIGSRGALPRILRPSHSWFQGPDFLKRPVSEWPAEVNLPEIEETPEFRPLRFAWAATRVKDEVELCKYNDWAKLRRIFAYMARYYYNKFTINGCDDEQLSVFELERGTILMIKLVQRVQFAKEIEALNEKKFVPKSSPLSSLLPYIDDEGVVRVGGSLDNAHHLPYDTRHPIILPKNHKITKSLIYWHHIQAHHVGPSGLLASIRNKYWPIQGKAVVNKVLYNCDVCRRVKPIMYQQIMGSLPKERVKLVDQVFSVTGIDYFGPVKVHYKGRGRQPTDAWVAVFVCFSTKAQHHEVVESLSTDAFLCAFRRFIAHHGPPDVMWSDNMKAFEGAKNELEQLNGLLASKKHWEAVQNWSRDVRGIQWRFIPPRSPHWGGLWEAAVKSSKYHLKRTIMKAKLTLTELWTLVAEVAAILNDRPLIPLATKPGDPKAFLTASHLIHTRRLAALPDPVLTKEPQSYQTRFKMLAALRQEFWQTWSFDYLQTLQQRYKWLMDKETPKLNDVVLMVEQNIPSIHWALGRIIKLYPGGDGKVRSVRIKTQVGEYDRAITQIAKLPVEPDETVFEDDASKGAGC